MSLKKILLLSVAVILAMPVASAQFKSGGYEELYDGETVSSLKKHVRNLSAAHLE